jgi:hypothetical protein
MRWKDQTAKEAANPPQTPAITLEPDIFLFYKLLVGRVLWEKKTEHLEGA